MNRKKILSLVLAVVLAAASVAVSLPAAAYAAAALPEQVVNPGGETANADDGMVISKTATPVNGLENVFDICLRVQSKQSVAEIVSDPDAAIVIVMDISNTMNEGYSTDTANRTSRYDAAMDAVNGEGKFIDKFTQQESVRSKIGFVAFNTSAHVIADMQACNTDGMASALKKTIADRTAAIIHDSNYSNSHTRFTNVEAGLAMAKDMLDKVTNRNKFIIFLSDGFPTTYLKTGTTTYEGYDPYTPNAKSSTDGSFYDEIRSAPCSYGTSYSDRAAIRAREKATAIKADGTEIYSIGIDVGAQTIQKYINSSNGGFSIVDVDKYTGFSQYELGSATDAQAFKDWLKNAIGSGHYFDNNKADELEGAFDGIFESIRKASQVSENVWKVTDPMNAAQSGEHIDFLQFFEKDGTTLHAGDLTGQAQLNGENTASFGSETGAINWDLKNSGYTVTASGGDTYCTYALKYRVRLINEAAGFPEGQAISTNGKTTVIYKIYEETDSTVTMSEDRELEFKIPQVKGYVSNLEFVKTNSKTGLPVSGAVFTLTHDDALCQVCKLTGVDRMAGSMLTTPAIAASDENGRVFFENIPSGHSYTLQETEAPEHYLLSEKSYTVEVSYDSVTVKDGSTVLDTPYGIANVRKNALTVEKQVAGDKNASAFEAESFLLQLKAGEQLIGQVRLPKTDGSWVHTFDDLADGTYTLTEQNLKDPIDGYSCSAAYRVGDGAAADTCQLTLTGGDEESVTVINTYKKPDPAQVTVSATKVLEGKDLAEDMFQFRLIAVNDDGTEGDVLETVSNKADGTVTFAPLFYEEVGVYRYLVKEVNGGKTLDSTTYSSDIYEVAVTVSRKADGTFQWEIAVTKDGKAADMVFVNTYTEPPTEPSTEPPTEPTPPAQTPPTGDSFLPALWSAAFLLSALGLACCLIFRKRIDS